MKNHDALHGSVPLQCSATVENYPALHSGVPPQCPARLTERA